MYTYKGVITNVVDGDTYDCAIDMGFSITVKHRLRLFGYDTPEKFRPKSEEELALAKKATDFAMHVLLGQTVVIITHKLGIYGRYEAEIYVDWMGEVVSFGELLERYGFLKKHIYSTPRVQVFGCG